MFSDNVQDECFPFKEQKLQGSRNVFHECHGISNEIPSGYIHSVRVIFLYFTPTALSFANGILIFHLLTKSRKIDMGLKLFINFLLMKSNNLLGVRFNMLVIDIFSNEFNTSQAKIFTSTIKPLKKV